MLIVCKIYVIINIKKKQYINSKLFHSSNFASDTIES